MYTEESILDILFLMLYGGAGMAALAAALYLWLRRQSALAPHVESPRELRLWAAAFLFAVTASHLWWLLVNKPWLAEERMVRGVALVMLDHVTLVPMAMAALLHMLQDRRRRLWPWLVAQLPIVAMGVAGIATCDGQSMLWMNVWQTMVIVAFVVRYALALREYNGWLLDNFADLEHKDVWRSLLVVVVVCVGYEMYSNNQSLMQVEYFSQWFTIGLVAFVVWRVDTIQRLEVEEERPPLARHAVTLAEARTPPGRGRISRPHSEGQGGSDASENENRIPLAPPVTGINSLPHREGRSGSEESTAGKLSAEVVKTLGQRLRKECEAGRLYLNPDLRIEQLAKAVESNRTYLGVYFVQQGTTYNDYINELRIRHFEQVYSRALQKGSEPPKAKNLATESGFSSYSTFGAAFKRLRGMTVAQWMRQQKNSSSLSEKLT